MTVIAIPLAVIVNIHFVGHKIVRAVFFFTSVPSLLVLALVWTYILSPLGSGVINYLLYGLFGVGPVGWLSDNRLAQLSVIMVGVWAQVGWHSVLYLGDLQSVPSEYHEAAVVDGASVLRRFFGYNGAPTGTGNDRERRAVDDQRPASVRTTSRAHARRARVLDVHGHAEHPALRRVQR